MDATRPAGHAVDDGASVRTRVTVPLRFADGYTATAEAVTFSGLADGREHLAFVLGDPLAGQVPLVRLHSECLTGDVFGSMRCDCGPQLREAVERIATTGGVLLYLRQEGRGIGLYNKLDAYALQDAGLDTYAANTRLGLPEDGRDYTAGAQMLTALGITALDLLTNNPDKARQLRHLGVTVRATRRTGVFATDSNLRYLHAKAQHTQHTIDLPDPVHLAAPAARRPAGVPDREPPTGSLAAAGDRPRVPCGQGR